MQINVALLNAEISYARRRLDICKLFTLSTVQNGGQKQLKRVGKQCRPRRFWTNQCLMGQFCQSGVNPNTCGRANSIWIRLLTLNVWTRIFSCSRTSIIRTSIIRISRLSGLFLWSQFGHEYLLVTIKIPSHILFKTTALKGAVKNERVFALKEQKKRFRLS